MKNYVLAIIICILSIGCNYPKNNKLQHNTSSKTDSNKLIVTSTAPSGNAALVDTIFDKHHIVLERSQGAENDTLKVVLDHELQDMIAVPKLSAAKNDSVFLVKSDKKLYYNNFGSIGDSIVVLGFADSFKENGYVLVYRIHGSHLVKGYPNISGVPDTPPVLFLNILKHKIVYYSKLKYDKKNEADLSDPYREVCFLDIITEKAACRKFYREKIKIEDPEISEKDFSIAVSEYYNYIDAK